MGPARRGPPATVGAPTGDYAYKVFVVGLRSTRRPAVAGRCESDGKSFAESF